jgi:serpin B
MNRRHVLTLSGALLAGALAGSTTGGQQPNNENPSTPGTTPDISEETLAELTQETNGLAFDLYDELTAATPGENLLASPVSITTALSMAYAGGRGETRKQMRETLRYTLEDDTLHAAFNALQRELNARGDDIDEDDLPSNYEPEDNPVPFQLNLVNAVWGQADYPFREEYLTLLADHYGGGLQEVDYLDFADENVTNSSNSYRSA